MKAVRTGCAALIMLLCASAQAAAPSARTPVDDDEVLLRVAVRDEASRALQAQRAAWRAQPQDAGAAAAYARAAIEQGRAESDPRWFGYAQAALAPWWNEAAPPLPVWILRATLKQQRHDFSGALADLDGLLVQDSSNAQARLTRAVIHMVQGRPQQAQTDCAALLGRASTLLVTACLSDARSRNGGAAQSLDGLQQMLATPVAQQTPVAEKLWALTLAAELALRLERMGAAQAAFDAAFAATRETGRDTYLETLHADFLLAQGQAAQLLTRYGNELRNDNLLLRVALAQQATGDARLPATLDILRTRFATARARGEAIHAREEAMLELHLARNAQGALRAAQDNWQTQREPLDARLLLQTSLAAGQPQAAAPALEWMGEHRIEDPALLRLQARLGTAP